MYLSRTMAKRADKSLQIPESRNIRQNSARIWRIRRVLANHAVLICALEPPRLTKRMSNMVRRDNLIGFVALSAVFALAGFGLACSTEESPTESAGTPDVAETATPDPTVSSLMEGVEVDKSLPPTVERVTIVEPLNPKGQRRGGVLAAPMVSCPPPDPAIDIASVWHGLSSPRLVTEIHAGMTRIVDNPASPFALDLAESYNVDLTGLEYEFALRNGLKFSDGSPLTAHDFKWSWERALEKSEAGSRARHVFGLVDGADAVILGDSDDLSGVVVIDDRSLRVRLTNPRADFPALLADPVASVLKKDNVLTWGMEWTNSGYASLTIPFNEWNMPVGAGPFQLVDYWEGLGDSRCSIAGNPHYWGEPAYLDGVWFRADLTEWEQEGDQWSSLPIDREIFVFEDTDFEEIPTIFTTEVSDDGIETEMTLTAEEGIEVDGSEDAIAASPSEFIFAVLNPAAPPFDDIRFRRAAAAYSRLTPYTSTVDVKARLITGELTTLEPRAEFIRYDEALAEAELAASNYVVDVEAREITVLSSSVFRVIDIEAPSFAEWARALNLDLRDDLFGVQALDEFSGLRNNDYHVRIFRVTPAYPDPITILRTLTAPFGKIDRAPEFVELDAMVAAAAVERDAVKRHEMYLDIEQYVAENALVIPISVLPQTEFFRTHAWVHDLNPPKYPGSVFHKVWLDHTAPKRELPKP